MSAAGAYAFTGPDGIAIEYGTPAHRRHVCERIAGCATELGRHNVSRADFLAWHRERYGTTEGVSTRSIARLGHWAALRNAALLAAQAGADVSDLDWDDVPDTWPAPVVPEGFYEHQQRTELDEDGNVVRQWVGARIEAPQGETTDAVPEGHYVKGVSSYIADGQVRGQWIKTARESESREQVLERLLRELPEIMPAREGEASRPARPTDDELLAVYPMGDPHVGLLSWAPETGESFDLKRCSEIMRGAIDSLVEHGAPAREALIVNLGDFFHSDSSANKTARSGHALDVDGRWPKVLRVGLEIMVYLVEAALRVHDRVRVINAIGNHDDHSAIFLSVGLGLYYRNEPRVEVEQSPSLFHYHRFGSNLLGVTHGHTTKHEDLESIMASDRAEEWGETRHRWWLCGHLHHKRQLERRGCVVEVFRTLAARDAWAHGAGYRSRRDMCRVTLHREYGEIARHTVSADYLRSLVEAA